MSPRSALLLGVGIFLVTLLVRLPAGLLTARLPAGVSCDSPSGTVWSGSCGELRTGSLTLTNLSWRVHPTALLRLRVAADLLSADARAAGHARVELSPNGNLQINDVAARLPLQDGLELFPAGWSGTLQLALPTVRIESGQLVGLQGEVTAEQLRMSDPPADLGSFELQFPTPSDGTAIVGQLRDLGGPLSLRAQLLLRGGAYRLDGSLSARANASPGLLQTVQFLGAPDAQGQRSFSLAGTL
jgi:hypothetical protein